MKKIEATPQFDIDSRRNFIRDFTALTGWVFLTGAEVVRSSQISIAGDPKNNDRNWGTVTGKILFDGEAPAAKEVELEKAGLSPSDLSWFKSAGPVVNQEWVVNPKTKAVQWVYVWVIPEDPKADIKIHDDLKVVSADRKLIVVEQEPIGYVPHALAIQVGQDILMKNSGPVAHVFNYTGFRNESFNKAMPPKSEVLVPNLKSEKVTNQINCPPHPWERMWLRVFDHPYFAVTKEDGSFSIPLAPSGKCRLVVWHEKLGFNGGKKGKDGAIIHIEGGAVTDLGEIKIKPV